MKKILFFITAIIFITGCGTSSSSLPTLSSTEALKSNILIFRNVNSTELAKIQRETREDFKSDKYPLREFAYSTSVTCANLGFKETHKNPATSQEPSEKLYNTNGSEAECLEVDYANTSNTGTGGYIVALPDGGEPQNISIN